MNKRENENKNENKSESKNEIKSESNDKNENRPLEVMFSYEVKKDNKVFLYWYDKMVKILAGGNAAKFLSQVEGADDVKTQLLLAKYTGNFKRKTDKGIDTIIIHGTHYSRNSAQH